MEHYTAGISECTLHMPSATHVSCYTARLLSFFGKSRLGNRDRWLTHAPNQRIGGSYTSTDSHMRGFSRTGLCMTNQSLSVKGPGLSGFYHRYSSLRRRFIYGK